MRSAAWAAAVAAAVLAGVLAVALAVRQEPGDGKFRPQAFTFVVGSDLHIGVKGSKEDGDTNTYKNAKKFVKFLNNWDENKLKWPEDLGGDDVQRPQGVILTGDLVNDGGEPDLVKGQWDKYTKLFAPIKGDAKLDYDVYEGAGNHDGGSVEPDLHSMHPDESDVPRQAIVANNANRAQRVHTSRNGLHYSWDWGPIHFVMLNLYPGKQRSEDLEDTDEMSNMEPDHALEFLKRDLRDHMGDVMWNGRILHRHAVLLHHLGVDHHSRERWTDEERAEYADVIKKYNVMAIFHGHDHEPKFYEWEGVNVFNGPSVSLDDEHFPKVEGRKHHYQFLVASVEVRDPYHFHTNWGKIRFRVAEWSTLHGKKGDGSDGDWGLTFIQEVVPSPDVAGRGGVSAWVARGYQYLRSLVPGRKA
ncbi:unnamed protein product [Pedinophyceae sp. YPF-701]|nr:unnamed protein product [Pedinophyceae sp. YPF-701]